MVRCRISPLSGSRFSPSATPTASISSCRRRSDPAGSLSPHLEPHPYPPRNPTSPSPEPAPFSTAHHSLPTVRRSVCVVESRPARRVWRVTTPVRFDGSDGVGAECACHLGDRISRRPADSQRPGSLSGRSANVAAEHPGGFPGCLPPGPAAEHQVAGRRTPRSEGPPTMRRACVLTCRRPAVRSSRRTTAPIPSAGRW